MFGIDEKLLLTGPPNSRVWVSSISTDSFGDDPEVVKGWTPDARGVFTDDLNRARHELATSFAAESARMTAGASATDIIGGLWHLKVLFKSDPRLLSAGALPKTIWIFSDMMSETTDFPIPGTIELGPERMPERVKANGLLVPLNGYQVYVFGASPTGFRPEAWVVIKQFWTAYFASPGAHRVSYTNRLRPKALTVEVS